MSARLALVFIGVAFAQSQAEQHLQDLLTEAQHAAPQHWADLLIQADSVAEKMSRREAPPDGFRRVRMQGLDLTYRWNEIQRSENYQHDLLKTVIRSQEGTLWGANALVALLENRSVTMPFRDVLEILQSKRWQALHDARLDRIRGEAYETWWSVSRAKPNEPALAKGADTARQNAIAAYERVLQVQPKDVELRHRVSELKALHDTNQRRWYPGRN